MVLMGTDKIDSKLDIELGGGKNWVAVVKFLARSPNILYATVNCVIQRVSVLIAMIELGHPQYIFAAASVIVGFFIAGKSLYRQRVKIANTIKPEEMDTKETTVLNRRNTAHQRLSAIGRSTHAAHAMNYATLRLSEAAFKKLVLKELPRVGFAALMAVMYFCSEAFGCLQRVKEESERMGINLENVTFCYDIPVDQCTKDTECEMGVGECEDIITSSTMFAILFVVYAALRLYVLPLLSLRYNYSDLMRFDMIFKDQVQLIVFCVCSVGCLLFFASSDEIDDWCDYVNPGNVKGDIVNKRSQESRAFINVILQFLMLLVFISMNLPSEFKRLKRVTSWLHNRMKSNLNEQTSVAPLVRTTLLLITIGLTLVSGPLFIYFAFMAKEDGKNPNADEIIGSRWALRAANGYAMMVSSWGVIFASMALFIFSRPEKKDSERKKALAYCLLPFSHILTAVGCWFLSEWEEAAGIQDPIFRRSMYNNIIVAFGTTCFYFPAKSCQELLNKSYDKEQIQSHILNIFTLAGTILLPAAYLFAESAGYELPDVHDPKTQVLLIDATQSFSSVSQYVICFIWLVNYTVQVIYVKRKLRRNDREVRRQSSINRDVTQEEKKEDGDEDNDDQSSTIRLERKMASCFNLLFRTTGGDENVQMSRALTLTVVPIPHLFLALGVYFYLSPADEGETGLLYVIWLASGDLALISCLVLSFSNLNIDSRWTNLDLYWMMLFCGSHFLASAHPDQNEPFLLYGFSTIYLLGALTIIYAKRLMMKYIRVSILKRHLINSTILTLTQLPSILFLSSEYVGCMLRAYFDNIEREGGEEFNLHTIGGSTFCASERSGTKAISFQLMMMISMQFAIGPFSYYDTQSELTIERISRLQITKRQGMQITLVFISFMLALYLFGTRGKSTEHWTKDQIGDDVVDDKNKLLYTIYGIWVFLWFTEVLRQIYEFLIDGDFLYDLRQSQVRESEHHRSSLGNARASIWNLKSVSNDDSFADTSQLEVAQAEQEKETEKRFKRFSSYGQTKKFIKAETKGDGEVDKTVFDFSPGML
ncbi:hypothetical protein TL16_g09369 [Triparma laevis f. inornata]|uniref:Uncharacterized protein n=1 Tax=Triparma laevis f. inornata TaxID=1714386 RepID=A0A9W7B2K4_9STRA|nr:hypothetical protein TL16_g09369 [Triparma laevis f. inornata]